MAFSTVNRPPTFAPVTDFVWTPWFESVALTLTPLGINVPQITTTQRDAIVGPQKGLLIYNSTTNKLNIYTGAWEQVTSV